MASSVSVLNMIQSIIQHMNQENFNAMLNRSKTVPVQNRTVRQLNGIASFLHKRALNRPKFMTFYANMCAELIEGGLNGYAGSGLVFRTVLLLKCQEVFAECCKIPEATGCMLSNRKTTYYVTNCKFVGKLFNLDVFPEETVWSFVNGLLAEHGGNLQIQCQCVLLKSAGPKLSRSYSMTRAVGQLLLLGNGTLRDEELSPTLTDLIQNIKDMYLMYWVHESPDELAMKRLYDDDDLKSYNFKLMSECIYDEFWELLFIYTYDEDSDENNDVERFLTPVLRSLLRHNRASFIASFIFVALSVEDDIIRTYAGGLLAALVKAERLSQFEVVSGFNKILLNKDIYENYIHISDLMSFIENEFEKLL